ncbi:MAG: type II secretion system F family protein [Firmicutes bacterium]|nr:type II secretion system F family protein [Bacillota bacterium]
MKCFFRIVSDQLQGRPAVFRELYTKTFGAASWEHKIHRFRRRTKNAYLSLFFGFGGLFLLCGLFGSYSESEGPWGLLAFGWIMGFLIIYMKRYDGPKKEIRHDKEWILRDYPDFVDRLLLLLNSGLVLSSAMQRLAEEGAPGFSDEPPAPLYRELYRLQSRVRESNASFIREFQNFAAGLGIRELMRFSAILSHSMQKGSSLREKLEVERELLLNSRKTRIQEWSRQAETKMVFPLMIQLLVLIFITIMPAMMSM